MMPKRVAAAVCLALFVSPAGAFTCGPFYLPASDVGRAVREYLLTRRAADDVRFELRDPTSEFAARRVGREIALRHLEAEAAERGERLDRERPGLTAAVERLFAEQTGFPVVRFRDVVPLLRPGDYETLEIPCRGGRGKY